MINALGGLEDLLGPNGLGKSSMLPPHTPRTPPNVIDVDRYERASEGDGPFLRLLDQPVDKFRFRYQSEMMGPHGCLPSRNCIRGKKGCPVVELCGFGREAVIKCTLVDATPARNLHAHKLIVRDQHDDVLHSVDVCVGPDSGYTAGFEGMGIVHTAKKDIADVLLQKYKSYLGDKACDKANIILKCRSSVKEMDLNKVCLKFSAHDSTTDREICAPVYSDVINNMKSAATGVLRIIDYSLTKGKAEGGDRVFMLVEKVMKKKIKINFFEEEGGVRTWQRPAKFSELDVHHQYAIVFETPAYWELRPERSATVQMELCRTSDGCVSEPRPFTYKANPQRSKRPRTGSISSLFSSARSGSIAEESIPTTVQGSILTPPRTIQDVSLEDAIMMEKLGQKEPSRVELPKEKSVNKETIHFSDGDVNKSDIIKYILNDMGVLNDPIHTKYLMEFSDLGALSNDDLQNNGGETQDTKEREIKVPTFGSRIKDDCGVKIPNPGDSEKKRSFLDPAGQIVSDPKLMKATKWIRVEPQMDPAGQIVSDPKLMKATKLFDLDVELEPQMYTGEIVSEPKLTKATKLEAQMGSDDEKSSGYSNEKDEVLERIMLMASIPKIKKIVENRSGGGDRVARLTELLSRRTSDGDCALHVLARLGSPALLGALLRAGASAGLPEALLFPLGPGQASLLHCAVERDSPPLLDDLLLAGCDPKAADNKGNTPVHLAVIEGKVDCLKSLLNAALPDSDFDIDMTNNEGLTPLLLTASVGAAAPELLELALEGGADARRRDTAGRTLLHRITLARNAPLLAHALQRRQIKETINAVDFRNHSPLHYACVLPESVAIPIVIALLDGGAHPLLPVDNGRQNALSLAKDKPEVLRLLKEVLPVRVKEENEDYYEEGNLVINMDAEVEEDDDITDKIGGMTIP